MGDKDGGLSSSFDCPRQKSGIHLLQASIVYYRKKTSVNHTVNGDLLSHIENSKNDKGYITQSTLSECQRAAQ